MRAANLVSVIATCLLCQFVLGQGGAMGGAGISQGNGIQGGNIAGDPNIKDSRVYNLILTPGQKGELPIEAEINDVIIADVSSDVFDPSVKLVAEKGKILAENDDITDGNQAARIVFRFKTKGKFNIIVEGFKGASGGPFRLRVRRFNAKPLNWGTSEFPSTESSNEWHFFNAKAAERISIGTHSTDGFPQGAMLDDSGEAVKTAEYPARGNVDLFMLPVEKDREYYVQVRTYELRDNRKYGLYLNPIQTIPIELDSENPRTATLVPGVHTSYQLTLKRGDLVRITGKTESSADGLLIKQLKREDEKNNSEPFWHYPGAIKNPLSTVVLIQNPGLYEIVTMHTQSTSVEYSLKTEYAAKELAPGANLSSLPVGETHYFRFDSKNGYVADLSAIAETFDAELEVFDAFHASRWESDDVIGLNPAFKIFPGYSRTCYVRLTSRGGGGGGSYALNFSPLAPDPFLNAMDISFASGSRKTLSFTAKKGETLMFKYQNLTGGGARLSCTNSDGQSVGATSFADPAGGTIYVYRFDRAGDYTFLLDAQGEPGTAKIHRVKVVTDGS